MFVLSARKQWGKSIFHLSLRRGHKAPSRLRLKRKDQNANRKLKDDPYIFHPRVRTVAPIRQALRNTKSVMNEGLPSVVLTGMHSLPLEEILPQIKDSVGIASSGEDDYSPKYVQRNKGILMNVIKAVWSCADRYPGLLKQTVSYRPYLKVSWNRFGYNFQVSGRTGLLFSSEIALPNFASSVEIEKTVDMSLEENDELISPVFELSQNFSGKGYDSGFYQDFFPYPQILVINEQNWKLPHLIAQGIMFSFGRLLERAVCKNGASFGDVLQNPMSIRSIVHNDQNMALLCYQLNTLGFECNEGVKNQLWLSREFPISHAIRDARRSKNLQNRKYDIQEFPENEFQELVAFLLHGDVEESFVQRSSIL